MKIKDMVNSEQSFKKIDIQKTFFKDLESNLGNIDNLIVNAFMHDQVFGDT